VGSTLFYTSSVCLTTTASSTTAAGVLSSISCLTVESALDTTGEAVVALEDAVVAVTDWTGGVVVAGADVIAACSGAAVVVGADTTLLVGAFTICWVRTIWGCTCC